MPRYLRKSRLAWHDDYLRAAIFHRASYAIDYSSLFAADYQASCRLGRRALSARVPTIGP